MHRNKMSFLKKLGEFGEFGLENQQWRTVVTGKRLLRRKDCFKYIALFYVYMTKEWIEI